MFTSIRDLLNRVNGNKSQQSDPSAIVVEISVKLPSSMPRELGPAIQKAISEAVMKTVTGAMSSRRSPFDRSPFGDDESDGAGLDIGDIISMALAARRRDERSENSPYGMPDLSAMLRSMRERMDADKSDADEAKPEQTPLEFITHQILNDYFDEDYSSPIGGTAFAALALIRDEYEALAAPEISMENVEKAMSLIERFTAGDRHCCGMFFCDEEITLQVLALHKELSITPEEVIAAYKAGDLSNKNARLAVAALAVWDDNTEIMFHGDVGFPTRMAARQLVSGYRDEDERYCTNCGGDFGCPVQLAFDTLVEYERIRDEEAAWSMHEAETQPAMAGVDADEGKNEAEQPSEPEFPYGVQQW